MPTGFHKLRIVDVADETDDAITLMLEPEIADRGVFSFTPGQHLTLRALIGEEDVRRNYSLCVPPSAGKLRVAIKKVRGGLFSGWAQDALKPGGTIESMAPRGHFTWTFEPGARRNYVAFAGGSGITPVLSLIASGLATEPESSFTLLYGNRASNSIMFLEELAALKNRHMGRLQIYHFLTAEADDVELLNGRLDAERIAQVLSSIVDPKAVDVVFICGPGGMMDAAERAMIDAGVDPDRVLVERFTSGRVVPEETEEHRAAARQAEGVPVQVTLDGRRRRIAFHADSGNILDSARAAGLPAPYACKAGVCATCRAKLISGRVHMAANYGLSKEEVAQGYILTCQSVPESDDVMVDYDA